VSIAKKNATQLSVKYGMAHPEEASRKYGFGSREHLYVNKVLI
jgi:hypothetical protein